jgi:hypothetical protein
MSTGATMTVTAMTGTTSTRDARRSPLAWNRRRAPRLRFRGVESRAVAPEIGATRIIEPQQNPFLSPLYRPKALRSLTWSFAPGIAQADQRLCR